MTTNALEKMRYIFYALLVRPALLFLLGFNIRHLERLKAPGPHLIAANHNSHLDALVLISLFKARDLHKVKLVAAKDYWCKTPFLTWFSINIIGIIPIDRKAQPGSDPTAAVIHAIDDGFTVIIFPEGSRGDPEKRQPLKYGIGKILQARPEIAVTPVFMHGLGKSLPRGEKVFVPFICEINIGEDLLWQGDRSSFIAELETVFISLEQEISPKAWL